MSYNFDNIPKELKDLKQWVVWKSIPRKNSTKIDKIPYNAMNGYKAQSNNQNSWTSFNKAYSTYKTHGYDGLGFMFANGFFGVDIDDVGEDIQIFKSDSGDNIISEFLNVLSSYAEYSPSRKGIHVICKGKLPEGGRRVKNVEMYQAGRFFTMTGYSIGNYAINECTDSIKMLHEKYIGANKPVQKMMSTQNIYDLSLGDSQIIDKAINSKNGFKFKSLYQGDWSSYNSQSEADIGFCNMLAYWTQRNPQQMDSIFRNSGLMRDKWDKRISDKTYGMITIQNAIKDCFRCYNPNYRSNLRRA